jgi:hypothetical protein
MLAPMFALDQNKTHEERLRRWIAIKPEFGSGTGTILGDLWKEERFGC